MSQRATVIFPSWVTTASLGCRLYSNISLFRQSIADGPLEAKGAFKLLEANIPFVPKWEKYNNKWNRPSWRGVWKAAQGFCFHGNMRYLKSFLKLLDLLSWWVTMLLPLPDTNPVGFTLLACRLQATATERNDFQLGRSQSLWLRNGCLDF